MFCPLSCWPCSCFLQPFRAALRSQEVNHTSHATRTTPNSFWLSLSRLYCMFIPKYVVAEFGLTTFTAPNPTVSGLPSSSTLMALLTSPLQSCRAITHSSWFFPVMSISCKEENPKISAFHAQKAPTSTWISEASTLNPKTEIPHRNASLWQLCRLPSLAVPPNEQQIPSSEGGSF